MEGCRDNAGPGSHNPVKRAQGLRPTKVIYTNRTAMLSKENWRVEEAGIAQSPSEAGEKIRG
jgi:hypothetical protein